MILSVKIRKYLNDFVKLTRKKKFIISEKWKIESIRKRVGIDFHLNEINTLVIGSSHGGYAFNPEFFSNKAYNLCTPSQDLYYSYKLYERFQTNLTNLKTVILFYSVFSPGFSLNLTKEFPRCVIFKKEFDIEYKNYDNKFFKYEKNYKKIKVNFDDILTDSILGYDYPTFFFPPTDSVSERANSHLRENKRNGNVENQYLNSLINNCRINNHKLVVVISPARNDYKLNLPSTNVLFKSLFDINLTYEFNLINLYDMEFGNELFGDSDHLTTYGAEIITKYLDKILQII